MARFRLYPTPQQEVGMREHCAHARYVWNLAIEQLGYASRSRHMPRFAEQSRQLAEARAAATWLSAGSAVVQQQALRDFQQACLYWWAGTHGRPSWRKAGRREGFRVVGESVMRGRRLNRRWSAIYIPKIGLVKFRRSRDVPDAKSYRVTRDAAGRWHVAFAVRPDPIEPPANGEVIGVDRGVAVTLAYSDGTMLHAPKLVSVRTAAQAVGRCRRGSNRRHKARQRLNREYARNTDRRRDFIEKATTDLARRADVIRVEDLVVSQMTRSARGTVESPGRNVQAKRGLNSAIRSARWGLFIIRLQHKAPGRVEKVPAAFTSQRCSRCGHTASDNRESQAIFRCRVCGHTANADVNAACNIAAGRAARGVEKSSTLKRRPQRATA